MKLTPGGQYYKTFWSNSTPSFCKLDHFIIAKFEIDSRLKNLTGTNTLAYLPLTSVKKNKTFIRMCGNIGHVGTEVRGTNLCANINH